MPVCFRRIQPGGIFSVDLQNKTALRRIKSPKYGKIFVNRPFSGRDSLPKGLSMTDFDNKTSPSAPLSGVTAFLLAGGRGKRLLPLTSHRPKPLLPLSGVPLLCRLLLRLDALGCPRAVITAGYLADILRGGVEDFLKSAPRSPRLSVDFFTEDSPLGTAGSVKAAYNALLSPEKAFREEGSPSETRSPARPRTARAPF